MQQAQNQIETVAMADPLEDSTPALIKVENVGKIFCRDLKRSLLYGVIDSLRDIVPFNKGRPIGSDGEPVLRNHEFWSNKHVSFELRKGECLGLIGHNGAGKTTLLRMINGLIKPDQGKIEIRGRVGALIALGAGFNPVLTGLENVYVNGSILGMSKEEIDDKLEDILEFASIGKFIDSPVQSYSSGMKVRLGFAVASTLQTDILIVDEVLAVGDFSFKQKCLNRISSYRENGGSILFVSHNLNQLQMVCTKGVYLSQGQMKFRGSIEEASNLYFEDIQKKEEEAKRKKLISATTAETSRAEILDGNVVLTSEPSKGAVNGQPATVTLKINFKEDIPKFCVRLIFLNKELAIRIATVSTEIEDLIFSAKKGISEIGIPLSDMPLVPENYAFRVFIKEMEKDTVIARKGIDDQPIFFRVANPDLEKTNLRNQYGDIVTLAVKQAQA